MYREQFLQYLDRYDNNDNNTPTLSANSLPFRRTQGTEWFRKPSLPSQSSRSQSLSQSERSSSYELLIEDNEQCIGATRQEGETYLSTATIINKKGFDVLMWWRENQATYPRLALVAMDILAIPIAGVGVERVFNIAKDVIGDRRHRLNAQTIRQLLVLKHGMSDEEDSKDLVSSEEPDDLFELPAQTEFDEPSGVEEDSGNTQGSSGLITQDNNSDREVRRPLRKRQRRSALN